MAEINVKSMPFLQVDIPDPEANGEAELDSLSALPIKDHYSVGTRKWLVGHECSGTYFSIYHDEIDTWIELFQAMKNYTGDHYPDYTAG